MARDRSSQWAHTGLRLWVATGCRLFAAANPAGARSEEHTSELQSLTNLVCRLLLEKKKTHRRPSAKSQPEAKPSAARAPTHGSRMRAGRNTTPVADGRCRREHAGSA